jgi:IS4 transposase
VFAAVNKDGDGAQLWTTMLWQLGVGLPWDWRIGKARASERAHLRKMVDQTPTDTLLAMDAGFTGYDLLRRIVDSGRDFLLRASGRAALLTELGYGEQTDEQTVYLWPEQAQRPHQPPLVPRLIRMPASVESNADLYLLTSVRDPEQLSDAQAGGLYRMRWGVELGYRSLKQVGDEARLRSHKPAQALFELPGRLLGLRLLGLVSAWSILQAGGDPLSWS